MARDTLINSPSVAKQPDQENISPNSHYGLRPNVLSHFETLAQSISCMAPTATPALLIPLVFASAGNGTWLAYLIATVSIMLVGANINQFASRSASPGSLYTYAAIGLGPGIGILTGWLLLCAYIVVLSCLGAEFALYAGPFFEQTIHLSVHPAILMLLCSAVACYIAWCDIKLSASVMLVIEFCSVLMILIVVAFAFFHKGSLLDWQQIRLSGVTSQTLSMGLVFAIFGYTGFESAASLGSEVKDPLTNIPKAITRSGLWLGAFYMICAYAMVYTFAGAAEPFNKCATPLATFASLSGVPSLGIFLIGGAVISFFACVLSCINTVSRLMFLMGHHGLFHSHFSLSHETNRTPHFAIIFATIIGFLPAIMLSLMHIALIDIVAWTGTISAYAFIAIYALVSIAAPAYLYKLGELKPLSLLVAVLAFGVMSLAFFGNFDPNAVGVAKYLPHTFAVLVIIGLCWYFALKKFAPEAIGSMSDDMEAIRIRFIKESN